MLVHKLLRVGDPIVKEEEVKQGNAYHTKAEIDYIKDIIRWVMESKMYNKKLNYSQNFL